MEAFRNEKIFCCNYGLDMRDVDLELSNRPDFKSHWEITQYNPKSPNYSLWNVDVVRLRASGFGNKVIIRHGYVPDTFRGLENEQFSFVNLDMDLYAPQLAGLRFFYDRMAVDGVILVHDYFSSTWKGCKKAIDEFAREQKLTSIPIGDNKSLAIIKTEC